MGQLGLKEILLFVLIIVVLFGARRIPELMRSLGSGVREFKSGMKDPDKPEGKSQDTNHPKP